MRASSKAPCKSTGTLARPRKDLPGKPVAYSNGLLSMTYGLLWGGLFFGLPGVPGPNRMAQPIEKRAQRAIVVHILGTLGETLTKKHCWFVGAFQGLRRYIEGTFGFNGSPGPF